MHPLPLLLALACSKFLVSAQNFLWKRDIQSDQSPAPATVSGLPSPTYTSGAQAVTSQLKADANAAIKAFAEAIPTSTGNSTTKSTAETAQLFQQIVKGAMSYSINQSPGASATPSQDRLNSMATTINATLNSINDVANKILSSSDGAVHYGDLKDCINGLVQQGGLQTGESCTMNGMSITGISNIMSNVLENFGHGTIPSSVISTASKALDPTFTAIIPGEKQFYNAVNDAMTSVQASVSGQLVAALNSAQNCFEQAVKQSGTYAEKLAFTDRCSRSVDGNSVYTDLKTLYLSVTNQMVGYLPPHIIDAVHTISDHYLDQSDTSSDDAYFRAAIANTTASIVASNSGNQVTYAYSLANCLDSLIGTTDPTDATNIAKTHNCLKKPDGPAASLKEIVYGYIQQIYGVLPPQLAAKIEKSGVQNLDPKAADYHAKVQALHETFMKTDPGPQYVTCYEAFVDCLFNSANGALEKPGNTQSVCLLGDSCQKTPDGLANSAVPLGRRALLEHLKHAERRNMHLQPTRVSQLAQAARIVRKYQITTPPKSYLLTSINAAFKDADWYE